MYYIKKIHVINLPKQKYNDKDMIVNNLKQTKATEQQI